MEMKNNQNQLDNNNDIKPLVDTWNEIDTVLESVDQIPKGDVTGAVLSTIEGPIMDYSNPTRNNRLYPRSLCQSIIHSTYVQELIESKCFLGEADHPEDNRLSVHFPYVSHAIRDIREDTQRGCYIATIDILDTPYGRILETLRRYGTKLGISSRGAGNTIVKNGVTIVDESSYIFVTFDIVHYPGVARARLSDLASTNESLSYDKDKLESLTSIFNSYINSSDKYNDESSLDEIIDLAISTGDYQSLNYYKSIFNALEVRKDLVDKIDTFINRGDNSELLNTLLSELSTTQEELEKSTKALANISSTSVSESDLVIAEKKIKELGDEISRYEHLVSDKNFELDRLNKSQISYQDRYKSLVDSKIRLVDKYEATIGEISKDYEDVISKLQDKVNNYNELLDSYKELRCNQLGVDINLLNQYRDINSVSDIERILSKLKLNVSPRFSNYTTQIVSVVEGVDKSDTNLVQLVKSLKS